MPGEDDFDLSAAGLRSDGSDLRVSIEVLAGKLEAALPGQTRVERRGEGLLGRGRKRVRLLQVALGEHSYELCSADEGVRCTHERRVGGIAIKREQLEPDRWIGALTADLREQAEQSAQARAALEGLLG
jgi:hypothetical protein